MSSLFINHERLKNIREKLSLHSDEAYVYAIVCYFDAFTTIMAAFSYYNEQKNIADSVNAYLTNKTGQPRILFEIVLYVFDVLEKNDTNERNKRILGHRLRQIALKHKLDIRIDEMNSTDSTRKVLDSNHKDYMEACDMITNFESFGFPISLEKIFEQKKDDWNNIINNLFRYKTQNVIQDNKVIKDCLNMLSQQGEIPSGFSSDDLLNIYKFLSSESHPTLQTVFSVREFMSLSDNSQREKVLRARNENQTFFSLFSKLLCHAGDTLLKEIDTPHK